MLQNSVQSVGLPRQVDVVANIGLLADQLVRLHDKTADVPADYLKGDITQRSRENRRAKPASAPHPHGIDACDQGAENERRAHNEHSRERDVRVGVGHTPENCMIFEQSLVSTEEHAHCQEE